MTQYIDKAAVVAEIERQQRKLCLLSLSDKVELRRDAAIQNGVYYGFLSFINTLEVKEMDLEEDEYMVDREIAREKSILDETRVEYFATGNPTIAAYSEDNLRNQFDAGADWMKEQIIKAQKGE